MQRGSAAAGCKRDEDEEAEDQKRESTCPQRATRRPLALPLHSRKRAYGSNSLAANLLPETHSESSTIGGATLRIYLAVDASSTHLDGG